MTATLTEVTVTVTQEHIDRGEPSKEGGHPVERAVLDSVPGAVAAEVWRTGLHVYVTIWFGPRRHHVYVLPGTAESFAIGLAEGMPVAPFTFTAEAAS